MPRILFFSGAGLSADSGLATFRDSNGLWDKYDPSVVCNYNNWRENYHLVHEFYNLRRTEYEGAEPNKMHLFIAEMQDKYGAKDVDVVTQNIDNLLEKALVKNVTHLHGRINYIHCVDCNDEFEIRIEFDSKNYTCKKCGSKIFKPSIVFFGEMAPMYQSMYESFSKLTKDDILVVVGTNGNVIPIASIASQLSATKILCNLEESQHIDAKIFDHVFYKRAEEAVVDIRALLDTH